MDLEHLNKTQVILLALLVSFVTSIATGIVTVSLMAQAPSQVAATVNHIIERTVQQMVPVAGPVSTTVKTVVVKNDDLAAQSIATARKSIVRIVRVSDPDTLVARGIIVDTKGTTVTDRASLDSSLSYQAILAGGSRVPVEVHASATSTPVTTVLLKLSTTTPALVPATFAIPSKLALGQAVLRIGGDGEDTVAEGVISSLPGSGMWVQASVNSTTPGSILVNLFGEVIGMTTTESLLKGNSAYSMPDIFKAAAESGAASANASQAAAVGAAGVAGAGAAGDTKSSATLPATTN